MASSRSGPTAGCGRSPRDRATRLAASEVLSHSVAGSMPQDLADLRRPLVRLRRGHRLRLGVAAEAGRAILGMWLASPDHWPLLMSARYNYLGVGLVYRPSSGLTFRVGRPDRIARPDRGPGRGRRRRRSPATTSAGRGAAGIRRCRPTPPGCATSRLQLRMDRGAWVTIASGRDRHRASPPRTGSAATGTACAFAPETGPATSGRGRASCASGCPDVDVATAPVRGGQPDQRPDPRLRRADQAPHPGAGGVGRPGRRIGRRGGPARHGLAPAPAPDQPAPERPLGLPDRRALPVHPRARRHARGRAVGPLALPEPARIAGRRRGAMPVRGPGRRDAPHGRPPPRRRPRPVRPLLRRPRPGPVPGAGRPAATAGQAAHPRGPVAADHRGRARVVDPRAASRPGRGPRARRLGAGRGDRPGLGLLPDRQAGPRRSGQAALGALAPAAPVRASSPWTTSTTSGATRT